MPAVIACPKCQKKYKLPDSILGKSIKCKSCGTVFQTKSPAKPMKSSAASAAPMRQQAPSAELAELGLDGPLRRPPDVFSGASAAPAKGPDVLGNLAADPGFADTPGTISTSQEASTTTDGLDDIFRNPYMPPPDETRKSKPSYGKGDPNYQYGSVKLWAILATIGIVCECLAWVGLSSIISFYVPSESGNGAATENAEVSEAMLYALGLILIFTIAAVAIQLFAAIMVMVFMYRSNCNVRALGATDLKISPGWSIGWWFIPFMNLFKPLQSMSEIYRASKKPNGKQWVKLPEPGKVNGWWLCFILANVFNRITERVEDPMYLEIFNWGGTALHIASGVFLVMVLLDINRMQSKHAASKYGGA